MKFERKPGRLLFRAFSSDLFTAAKLKNRGYPVEKNETNHGNGQLKSFPKIGSPVAFADARMKINRYFNKGDTEEGRQDDHFWTEVVPPDTEERFYFAERVLFEKPKRTADIA